MTSITIMMTMIVILAKGFAPLKLVTCSKLDF